MDSPQFTDAVLILVADDDPSSRFLLRRTLETEHYRVEEAADGVDALRKCVSCLPDLILLDVLMPHMNGFDLCRKLQSIPTTKDIPVIIVTALSDPASIDQAFQAGAADYITKPIHFATLLQRAQRLLQVRQSQAVLHEERTLLRILIDNVPDYIFIKDLQGRFLESNLAHARAAGASKGGELIGKMAADFFPPELAAQYDADDRAVMESGKSLLNLERTTIWGDGTRRSVLTTKVPLKNNVGHVIGLVGVSRDITERKQEEEARRLLEERFRVLVQNSSDMVTITDREGIIHYVSPACERLLGYTPNEMSGRSGLDFVLPDDLPKAQNLFGDIRYSGATVHVELRVAHKDGSLRTIEGTFTNLMEHPAVKGVVGNLHDITDRKRAEEALARSNTELEQFAYIASHDLQEPLRMVTSYVQLLAARYQGQLSAEADEFIGYVVDGVNRMQHLIDDLLAYSRVSSSTKPMQPVNLETIYLNALSNLQVTIAETHAVLMCSPLPYALGDETGLIALFQNVLGNALKFHSDQIPMIQIEVQPREGRWLVAVKDNGIGIPPEHHDKIFEIFKRMQKRSKYPGNGIGLAICRKIVEHYGGTIWVESEVGRGSTFYFTLPRCESNPS